VTAPTCVVVLSTKPRKLLVEAPKQSEQVIVPARTPQFDHLPKTLAQVATAKFRFTELLSSACTSCTFLIVHPEARQYTQTPPLLSLLKALHLARRHIELAHSACTCTPRGLLSASGAACSNTRAVPLISKNIAARPIR
jgi:hypothetical protein